MASTSITTVGGVVVVTQVIPKDEKSIQLQAPPRPAQAPPQTSKLPPTKMDVTMAALMQGGPHVLGVVQIFVGLLCVLFSLTAVCSHVLLVHSPLGLAVTFVVSGSLALAASKRRLSLRLVWASLVSNVLGATVGLVGVAYVCWLLADEPVSARMCAPVTEFKLRQRCIDSLELLEKTVYGSLGLILVLLVVQVCVAVTVCVFSVKAIRCYDRYTPIMVEVDDGSSLQTGAAPELDGDVAMLDSGGEETSTSPLISP